MQNLRAAATDQEKGDPQRKSQIKWLNQTNNTIENASYSGYDKNVSRH